jgi:hypothetical protein
VIIRVWWSKRISRYSGTVDTPLFRNLGRKNNAMQTSARTATTSHTMTENPYVKAAPFRPTICSVDRFVSNSDPAMSGHVRLLPARKYPSLVA